MYVLKTFDKVEFTITDEEAAVVAKAINDGKQKAITIQGNLLTLSSISMLLKQEHVKRKFDTNHKIGVLKDGRRVIKQYGTWYLMNPDFQDDNGNYTGRPDPDDCPEVRFDCVPSVRDYEQVFWELPVEQWAQLLLESNPIARLNGPRTQGLEKIETDVKSFVERYDGR